MPAGPKKAALSFLEDSSFIREYLWKYRALVGVGLVALIVLDVMEILPPIFIKEAIDIAVDGRPARLLGLVALAYFGTAVVQALCRYGWRMYLIRAGILAGRDLRGRFAEHLFGLSVSFFDRRRIGDLMSLSTSDTESVRMAIGAGLLVFADALFYFASVPVAMYLLSPKLTLLAFLPLPIVPWLVMRNERAVHERFEKLQEAQAGLSAQVQESLNGVRVIKAFAAEDVLIGRIRGAGEEFVRLALRLARVQVSFGPILDFTMSMGMVLLIFVGGRELIFNSRTAITVGTFVAFQRYIQKLVWPMAAIGMAVSYYQRAVSSSGRLKEVFGRKSDVLDVPEPARFSGSGPWRTPGKVEFRGLSFAFPGTERLVLRNINLTIRPGERVAFIGAIGAGKSALLSLLPRLYPVGTGMLFVDDVDVNHWPLEELRRQVGYVSQDVFLFSETVTDNVAFGPHELPSVGQGAYTSTVEAATELAAVHEDVLGLVGSYQTRLGERGVNLSGGQKQRLTIARALAKQPAILVLDDALSSVDVQTEEKILQGLRARPLRNTEIIAAHRISTIRDADRIVVLEDAVIRQIGTHHELVADRRGAYRRYYEEQQLKEELEHYEEKLDAKLDPGGAAP